MRIDSEPAGVIDPGLTDGLKRGLPVQRLEVFGEVVGRNEGQDMRFQALEVFVMEDLHGRIFDRPVHSLGLSFGPRMVGLGQTMLDADASEHMRTEKSSARPSPVLRQIGERHAVIGQNHVKFVGESCHHVFEEG